MNLKKGSYGLKNVLRNLRSKMPSRNTTLKLLSKSGGRDADYIISPIPDGVWEWVKQRQQRLNTSVLNFLNAS